jgi:hypothetical protein
MKQLTLILSLLAIVLTANAQTIYNSRTTYDVAHPSDYVIDFNSLTPAPVQYTDYTASTPFGNVTFDAIPSANNIEFTGNNLFPFLGANNLVLYDFNGQPLVDSLLITLPANTFSFGLDLVSPSTTVAEPYQLKVFSGATLLQTLASPSVNNGYTFIGYDSLTSPITSVAIQITNAVGSFSPTIDNFTIVPEPATTALIGAGGIALLLFARPRMRS